MKKVGLSKRTAHGALHNLRLKTRKGFTCGAFDLLHAGHLDFLKKAREQCDYLIIGLHTDPTIDRPDTKNKPCETTYERWCRLDAVKHVDEIIPYDTEEDLYNLLVTLNIHVRFLGADYINKSFTGEGIKGIDISYINRNHGYSSSALRKKIIPS